MAQQRILVTGAQGALGQDLLARLRLFDEFEVIGTTRSQLDLSAPVETIHQTLDEIRPDILINTAAVTAVDAAETDYDMAIHVNAHAPQAMAEWASQHGAYLIHISTDYVFDGQKSTSYTPQDTPSPINRYGHSKWLGEKAVLSTLPNQGLVLRTSWLFGSHSKNFVSFVMNALKENKQVRIAMDQHGTPTWTGHLCKMILTCLNDRPTGILHGCNTGSTTRYEQAQYLREKLNAPESLLTPVLTEAFNFPAPRPVNTSMVCSFPDIPSWQEATDTYLAVCQELTHHA